MKSLALATITYANDHGGRLPLADNWRDAILPWAKNANVFHCPSAEGERDSYAYNAALSSVELAPLASPSTTVLLFDGPEGANVAGGKAVASLRHSEGAILAFADGHVKWADDLAGGRGSQSSHCHRAQAPNSLTVSEAVARRMECGTWRTATD